MEFLDVLRYALWRTLSALGIQVYWRTSVTMQSGYAFFVPGVQDNNKGEKISGKDKNGTYGK